MTFDTGFEPGVRRDPRSDTLDLFLAAVFLFSGSLIGQGFSFGSFHCVSDMRCHGLEPYVRWGGIIGIVGSGWANRGDNTSTGARCLAGVMHLMGRKVWGLNHESLGAMFA